MEQKPKWGVWCSQVSRCKPLSYLIFKCYWNITDLECCLVSGIQQSKSVIHRHSYMLFFKILFLYSLSEYWGEFPVLSSGSLLIFYFIYSRVCLLIFRFLTYPFPVPASAMNKFVLSVCDLVSVLWISSFVSFFKIPHISDIMWYFSLSLH